MKGKTPKKLLKDEDRKKIAECIKNISNNLIDAKNAITKQKELMNEDRIINEATKDYKKYIEQIEKNIESWNSLVQDDSGPSSSKKPKNE